MAHRWTKASRAKLSKSQKAKWRQHGSGRGKVQSVPPANDDADGKYMSCPPCRRTLDCRAVGHGYRTPNRLSAIKLIRRFVPIAT
jgi:hypothetical protein